MSGTVIVVPCYNEAQRLDAAAFVDQARSDPGMSFLFVDDGSKDATRGLLEAACQGCAEQLSVLSLPVNQGKAEAVRRGLVIALATGAPVVGYLDADLATPLAELPPMRALFDQRDIEIVMGSRVALLGRDVRRSFARHYLGRCFATAASCALDLTVYDTQCGAKMFRNTALARRVFDMPFASTWAFDVEILARFARALAESDILLESRAVEYPLRTWRDVRGSKLGPRAALGAAVDLWRIWRRQRESFRTDETSGSSALLS